MAFAVSDELLATFVPIAVYWLYSALYIVLDALGTADCYRLHPKEDEETRNIPSKRTVLKGVLLQQAVQVAVSLIVFKITGDGSRAAREQPPAPVIALQFVVAMFAMDTWQYFVHMYLHTNKFLYKHVHAQHHTILVPYAFGALYSHPLEGLLMDTASGAVGFLASGMTPRTAIFFISLGTIKTVDDHCGLWLPGNVLHAVFANNSAFHNIHHQLYGNKHNFSQPFFVVWDKILGTYMPFTLQSREGGGVDARPLSTPLRRRSSTSPIEQLVWFPLIYMFTWLDI